MRNPKHKHQKQLPFQLALDKLSASTMTAQIVSVLCLLFQNRRISTESLFCCIKIYNYVYSMQLFLNIVRAQSSEKTLSLEIQFRPTSTTTKKQKMFFPPQHLHHQHLNIFAVLQCLCILIELYPILA